MKNPNILQVESAISRRRSSGDLWTQEISTDGASWSLAGSYNHSLSVSSVGLFSGNMGGNPATRNSIRRIPI